MTEIHPLDQDDDFDHSPANLSPSTPENAVKQKLRRMVWVAAVIGALVVISSVAMNGVTYATQAYWMAYVANRILMFLLLATFAGILAVYQRANIRSLIERMKSGPTPKLQAATGQSGASHIISPMAFLILANLILLALIWGLVMFSTSDGAIDWSACVDNVRHTSSRLTDLHDRMAQWILKSLRHRRIDYVLLRNCVLRGDLDQFSKGGPWLRKR